MRLLWVPLVLVSLTVAGCLGGNEPPAGDGDADADPGAVRYNLPEDPMPEGPGHDHGDPGQHRFLWNYEFSRRDALMQDDYDVAGLHALDVKGGHLFGAVYGAHAASVDGGLVIWSLEDPADPKQVGRWTIPGSVGGDRSMEATSDGAFVVLATEAVDCAGHVNPLGAPVQAYLLDTRNKADPKVVDVMTINRYTLGEAEAGRAPAVSYGTGQHSVAVQQIGGSDYAFIWGKLFRIEQDEDGGRLVYVRNLPAGHDTYVRHTPWNTTWALISYGGGSQAGAMVVWDVTVPEDAFPIGYWDLEDREALEANGTEHYFHTADVSFQDGKIVIVQTSEDFADHVSPLWVIDGDPLANMTEKPSQPLVLETMGMWSNPGEHVARAGLTFSLHNPRFHDGGILTIASYHGGMWQLDLRYPEFWADPAPIAYAAFAEGTPPAMGDPVEGVVAQRVCGLDFAIETPSYWDVEVGPNGITYLADGIMGLYTFKPTDSHPVYGAERRAEYPGTAWV